MDDKLIKNASLSHLTEIQRAVRFLYLSGQGFGGKGGHYGYSAVAAPHKLLTAALDEIRERLKNTYVENLPFDTVIDKYDRAETLFFADPPYYGTTGYGVKFDQDEHIQLRDKLDKLRGKFILTINDCEQVREWYDGYKMQAVEVSYSVGREISSRRKFGELIVTNF